MSPDERAIRDVIATWLRASAESDTSTVLSLMSDDVIFLVAARPPFGKKEFAAGQNALATHRVEASSEVLEVVVDGDLGYARSQLTVAMTPLAGGATLRRSGPVLSIFRRLDDGRWVLSRDANLLTVEGSR
ncbi:MAG TPA: SgcJ/EcaC family oxidoreductase [Gemmatimonadaceae bacterium]|nr:SgcJ/EcaC family oxidoreductase [Gemmatimonadaceae bacterium]